MIFKNLLVGKIEKKMFPSEEQKTCCSSQPPVEGNLYAQFRRAGCVEENRPERRLANFAAGREAGPHRVKGEIAGAGSEGGEGWKLTGVIYEASKLASLALGWG